MKIGFYVQRVAGAPGFESVVSAHVQLPLHAMKLLQEAGHAVELITTEFHEGHSLPDCLPVGTPVRQVPYGSSQGSELVMYVGNKRGIRPWQLLRQLRVLQRIINEEQYDLVHFVGSQGVAHLAAIVRLLGAKSPAVVTLNTAHFPRRFNGTWRHLWKRISVVITSTQFMRQECARHGVDAVVLKHGVVRQLKEEVTQVRSNMHRVVYWRDPSWDNGADVCVDVFRELAPRFPEISFDIAVRPHWSPVLGLMELSTRYPNVNLHQCPYKGSVSIADLLAEAVCVLLPFRRLSTHPQLAIMESMAAGAAVVTTDVGSNEELIEDGRNGILVDSGDVRATLQAVEALLLDPAAAQKIGANAAADIAERWSWERYVEELLVLYEMACSGKLKGTLTV